MKRILCLILAAVLLLSLCACYGQAENKPEFYYLRSADSYQYNSSQPVIVPDDRNIQSGGDDLAYSLQLYLEGPVGEKLTSPFPEGLRLEGLIQEKDCLIISLSPEYMTLEGIGLTLAGACLAKTCFSLSEVSRIRIQCGTKTWEYHRDSFLFTDSGASQPTE